METGMKMMLAWESGGQLHRRLVTSARPLLLGRLPKCDLVISDSTVAGEHALLYATANGFCLQNLSPVVPIIMEAQGVIGYCQTAELEAGAAFCLGQVRLEVMALDKRQPAMKVRCVGCQRLVVGTLAECPWCGLSLGGSSLAGTSSFVLDGQESNA